jgi:hypothetical protein
MLKVAVVGLGPSGLFCLKELSNKFSITVFDVGPPYEKRKGCPIDLGKIKTCPKVPCRFCPPAQAGGIFSDYKVITTASPVIGGRLYGLLGERILQEKLNKVKETILNAAKGLEVAHATPNSEDIKYINSLIGETALKFQFQHLIHCGTDNAVEINTNILKGIDKEIDFKWGRKVTNISKQGNKFIIEHEGFKLPPYIPNVTLSEEFDLCVISVGRGGTNWLSNLELYSQLEVTPGQVDIGVRVETLSKYTKELDKRFYEPKMYLTSSKHNDLVRNFCSNPGGFVCPENHEEYVLVNGHSKSNIKSLNNNFAILVSKTLEPPFKSPQLFGKTIAKAVNMLAGGGPLVQRFGDLKSGRRSRNLVDNSVVPTLQAECGDLSFAYPHRIMEGIIEYLNEFDKICKGAGGDDTLLYGPEIKTFPNLPKVSINMETNIENLYIIGDASGATRSIGQSSVSGLMAAEGINAKI